MVVSREIEPINIFFGTKITSSFNGVDAHNLREKSAMKRQKISRVISVILLELIMISNKSYLLSYK
jgi:hypothetical protein